MLVCTFNMVVLETWVSTQRRTRGAGCAFETCSALSTADTLALSISLTLLGNVRTEVPRARISSCQCSPVLFTNTKAGWSRVTLSSLQISCSLRAHKSIHNFDQESFPGHMRACRLPENDKGVEECPVEKMKRYFFPELHCSSFTCVVIDLLISRVYSSFSLIILSHDLRDTHWLIMMSCLRDYVD